MAISYPRVIDMFEDIYNPRKIQRAQRAISNAEFQNFIIPYIEILDEDMKIEGVGRVSKEQDGRQTYVIYGKSEKFDNPAIQTLNFGTGEYINIIMADHVIDEEDIRKSIRNLMFVFTKLTPPCLDHYTKHVNVMKFVCALYILEKIDVESKDKLFKLIPDEATLVLAKNLYDYFYGDHYDMIFDLQSDSKTLDMATYIMLNIGLYIH